MVFAPRPADIDTDLREALARGGCALQALRRGRMPVAQAVQAVHDCFTGSAVRKASAQQQHFILREARGRLRDACGPRTPPSDLQALAAAVQTLEDAADAAQEAAEHNPSRGLAKFTEVTDRALLQQVMAGLGKQVPEALLEPISAEQRGAGERGRGTPLLGRCIAGVASAQGRRPAMEDAAVAYVQNGLSIAGVFDGHGGNEVAQALTRLLPKVTQRCLRAGLPPSVMRACLKDMCAQRETDTDSDAEIGSDGALLGGRMAALAHMGAHQLARFAGVRGNFPSLDVRLRASVWRNNVGSTVVFTVVDQDQDNFYVANIGDSRAVLVQHDGAARRLTVDHSPHGLEYERVLAEQGEVVDGRLDGILNIARSVGDWQIRALGRRPQISAGSVHDGRCIIMASDGFFGVISDEEAARLTTHMLADNLSPAAIATRLTAAAIHAGTHDNVTVNLLQF